MRLALERLAFQPLAYTAHYKADNGEQHEDKDCQLPRDGNHHGQAGDNHDRIFENHVERRHNRVLDFGHVAAHTCHDVALALDGKEADWQGGDFVVDIVADIAHDTRAHRYDEVGAEECRTGLEAGHDYQGYGEKGKGRDWSPQFYGLLHIVVEIVDHYVFKRCLPEVEIGVDRVVDFEKHLQYWHH